MFVTETPGDFSDLYRMDFRPESAGRALHDDDTPYMRTVGAKLVKVNNHPDLYQFV